MWRPAMDDLELGRALAHLGSSVFEAVDPKFLISNFRFRYITLALLKHNFYLENQSLSEGRELQESLRIRRFQIFHRSFQFSCVKSEALLEASQNCCSH
uniref:Uncharacterized protein n=1 Tax=Physcomitrium patens TaxID=3218 RepID=A0A2K1IBR7_PHYPA|nr:hypothetical protein PHYPA_030209 [Physcomitrium patens]